MINEDELLACTDPLAIFESWYGEVQKNPEIREPTAMTLATVDHLGRPSLRKVLLKNFSAERGFVFYTNYLSHKGQDLAANPMTALLFYWDQISQQIKIQGRAEKVSRAESEKYWHSRPYESKLAGWVSQQSKPVQGSLKAAYEKAEHQWHGHDIPCPEHWGGYVVKPSVIEFWIGHKHRLHTSVRFEQINQSWLRQQLYP